MMPARAPSGTSRFDAILIDLDDTLFDFKWSQKTAFERTLSTLALPTDDELLATFNHLQSDLWASFEAGTLSKDEVFTQRFERLMAHLERQPAPTRAECRAINQTFLDHLAAAPKLIPGAEALCEHLRSLAPLVAVTNGDAHVQRRRLANTSLVGAFDHLVVSDDLGVGKPDPIIFRHAVRLALGESLAAQVRPDRVLMIGDNIHADIGGAAALGYTTVWLDWHGRNSPLSQRATHVVASLAAVQALV